MRYWPIVRGIHRSPVDSPHKGPVTQKMFSFDDIIIWRTYEVTVITVFGFSKHHRAHLHSFNDLKKNSWNPETAIKFPFMPLGVAHETFSNFLQPFSSTNIHLLCPLEWRYNGWDSAVVYSTVYSDADQRKHQSSAPLAFVWEFTGERWILRTNGQ